ncbi:nuclear envelope pore membrane protein POM 121C-like [Otolemur garnettii]|uniref:nuclear envelope pore membrane protein POM 121C-like n=1 Tax=Otolemur garnettii TaxID=30611 RepID=UPI000644270B|nr:nuclear envelope pore membrane protein POM 121C-like [Otolemur garnettii]
MGGYLGKLGMPQPAPAQEGRDQQERLDRCPAAWPPPPALRNHHVHHVWPSLPTPLLRAPRRPCHRDCGTSSKRYVMTPRRWHPLRQARYSLLGVLPTVCWDGCPSKKILLSVRHFRRVGGPVPVRIPPLDRKWTRSAGPEQVISSALSSPPPDAPNPRAKDTVQSALQDRTKKTVGGEDQIFADGQESQRRCHDSSGTAHSALEPLVAKGVPASLVPEPESLKRGPDSQSSENPLNKRSCSSCASSLASTYTCGIPVHSRNAISSSYSSTRGFSQLQKRRGPSSSPSSSHSQTQQRPAKKIRGEEPGHHSRSSTPPLTDKESQGEKAADTTTWKEQNSWSSPSTPGSSRPRKRKFQLLPSRRGELLTLPPPPQLGYSVTAEDLDLEKKATFDWFNKLLGDTTDAASNYPSETPTTMQPSFTFTPSPAETASSMASLPDASSNPLLQSWNQMQNRPSLPSFPESARLATTQDHPSPMTHGLLAGMGSSQSGPLPATTIDSTSTVMFMELVPASSIIPATEMRSTSDLPEKTSVQSQALSAPSHTPKREFHFGMLSTPPSNPPSSAAPAMPSSSPLFMPLSMAPPSSQKKDSQLSVHSFLSTAHSSFTLPTTTITSALSFQPVFSNRELPPSMPLSAPFFKHTTIQASPTVTTTPVFTGLATATSAVASISTGSTSGDPALKSAFGHGLSSVNSTKSSVRRITPSTAQPFLFGAPPASGASFTPAKSSTFQVGKRTAKRVSTMVTTSGQSPLSAVQTTSSSSSVVFHGFGDTLTTSSPAPTSQPALMLSNTMTPAFNIPFGSSNKPHLPSFPGASPQPAFGAADGQPQGNSKPALTPSSFTFGNSAAPAPLTNPAPTPGQPAFGSAAHSAFRSLVTIASAFSTPANTQPAFASTMAVFSFGEASTSNIGAITQTSSSWLSSSVFGPFSFGVSAVPLGSADFGINVSAPGSSSTSGAFGFGAGKNRTTGITTVFGGSVSQSIPGTPSRTSQVFSVASTPDNKPVFGATSSATFHQNTTTTAVGTSGSSPSFGVSSTPTQGFVGVGPIRLLVPSFSIGVGSKTPGVRQRLQARRQLTRKK